MNGSISPKLLQALLGATEQQRAAALRLLQGKATSASTVSGDKAAFFLSMTDAATYAGVSRTTLYNLIQMGRLKPVELLPGFRRIRRSDIEALAGGPS